MAQVDGAEALTAVCAEPNSRFRAIVGYSTAAANGAAVGQGGVAAIDLATGKISAKVCQICRMCFSAFLETDSSWLPLPDHCRGDH